MRMILAYNFVKLLEPLPWRCHINCVTAVLAIQYCLCMQKTSYDRYRFPPLIIQHAVWLYFRFPLSYRDVEDLLAERGIDVSFETIRRWALKFGQAYARELRKTRPRPNDR